MHLCDTRHWFFLASGSHGSAHVLYRSHTLEQVRHAEVELMPIYEYKCNMCDKVTKELRPVSECREPLTTPCLNVDKPEVKCHLKRIMSPTPTTFRFNDNTGYKGTIRKHKRG